MRQWYNILVLLYLQYDHKVKKRNLRGRKEGGTEYATSQNHGDPLCSNAAAVPLSLSLSFFSLKKLKAFFMLSCIEENYSKKIQNTIFALIFLISALCGQWIIKRRIKPLPRVILINKWYSKFKLKKIEDRI